MKTVIVCPSGKYWVAQCLEMDWGAQGSSLEELRDRFIRGYDATIMLCLQEQKTPPNGDGVPKRYKKAVKKASMLTTWYSACDFFEVKIVPYIADSPRWVAVK